VRDDRERLADVLATIDRIRRHVQDDRTRFDTDELLQNAVLSLDRDHRRNGTRRQR
jgi:uncharacterized protein with HEPN domain